MPVLQIVSKQCLDGLGGGRKVLKKLTPPPLGMCAPLFYGEICALIQTLLQPLIQPYIWKLLGHAKHLLGPAKNKSTTNFVHIFALRQIDKIITPAILLDLNDFQNYLQCAL